MSTMVDLYDLAVTWHPCGFCGQPPGQWCRARSRTTGQLGRRSTYPHGDRTYAVWQAYGVGCGEGARMVLNIAAEVFEAQGQPMPAELVRRTSWLTRR